MQSSQRCYACGYVPEGAGLGLGNVDACASFMLDFGKSRCSGGQPPPQAGRRRVLLRLHDTWACLKGIYPSQTTILRTQKQAHHTALCLPVYLTSKQGTACPADHSSRSPPGNQQDRSERCVGRCSVALPFGSPQPHLARLGFA